MTGNVGSGGDTLHPQLEIIGVRSALQSRFVVDQAGLEEVPQRLVEGLHAVLGSAGGNGIADGTRLFRHENTFANVGGINHDFHRGYAPFRIGALYQSLADDGAQHGRQLQSYLLLLGWREDGDNAVDGFHRIESVQSGEDHVAGFGSMQRRADRFQVTHFAHQNHIGVLA